MPQRLKYRAGVLWPGARLGCRTRFGLCSTKPAKALLFVACVTVTGIPDCSSSIVFSVQPPNAVFAKPVDANACPRPTGSW